MIIYHAYEAGHKRSSMHNKGTYTAIVNLRIA